jgi:hypothetical protein
MKKLLIGALCAPLINFSGVAGASGMESLQLAMHLGDVLASEQPCGLSYDQAAISAFIANKVKADDMGFTSNLNIYTFGATSQIRDMSTSQKTAHCAQIKRVAKQYKFIN